MELRAPPSSRSYVGLERIARERLPLRDYLTLYRNVGGPVRWDQRLQMPEAQLRALLESDILHVYVLRNSAGDALGFCEFDRSTFPEIEVKNFGLVREAQGRGLGSWLLCAALSEEWESGATRIWLHTDNWDHPSAIPVYERAGFRAYASRDEASGPL
jgi:GNAT superfamily N-acetyltransferase